MQQKKRKKWWQVRLLEFSWKTSCYYFITMMAMMMGVSFGSKEWINYFFGLSNLGSEHIIFPVCIVIVIVFFMLFRHQAKKDYIERDLGHPKVYEK